MSIRKFLGAIATVLTLATASLAQASTTTSFVGSPVQGYDGVSLNGWTFSGNWQVYGNDALNVPFMETYTTNHSISYDAGVFNFQSMSLSGWPWDNYFGGSNFVLSFSFLNTLGQVILSDSITLANSSAFLTYTNNVAGVHSIFFNATGGNIGPNGQWVNGFWPRLASITTGSDVPEPASVLLLAVGLMALLALRANKRA